MSITIQQSLRPLFLMCFIMGLGEYPIKQSTSRFQWIAYLSILYFVTIWFVYGSVVFYTFTIFASKIFHTTSTRLVITIINSTAITSAISIFYHYKLYLDSDFQKIFTEYLEDILSPKNIFRMSYGYILDMNAVWRFQIYMKKLASVNDTLEKLGIPKTYRKLHILSIKVIIGWIIHAFIKNIYDITWSSNIREQISWGLILPNIISHPTHINEFADLMFIFLLWYIGTRFDKINDHMQCLLQKKEYGLKYMWKEPIITHGYFLHKHNYKRTLWTSMQLYLELCRVASELNVIFGIQITFGMVCYLVCLTSLCYYLCRILQHKHQDIRSLQNLVGLGFWSFICFIRLYAVNHICDNVKNKAHNIGKIIYQLTNILQYDDMRNEIYFFSLQVMQHPLKFTGLGLFFLGNKFLQKFFTTIVTFVIIMIQLNME